MTVTATARDLLTQPEAEARAVLVSNAAYTLDITLVRGAETYRGDVTVTFDLATVEGTFLDFRGKTIDLLEINGAKVEPERTEFRLMLPESTLSAHNTVRIVYENEYDHGGDGFHQFKDPEDGQEYLYSNFEPYEAHRLFPCFDQPDIKGVYALTVTAPAEWEVIGNSAEASRTTLADGRMRRVFEPTKKFSTYLFALIAGPYHAVHETHGQTTLGLYCRKSLAKHLDTEELFTISKQGLDFFGTFFDRPYEPSSAEAAPVLAPKRPMGSARVEGCPRTTRTACPRRAVSRRMSKRFSRSRSSSAVSRSSSSVPSPSVAEEMPNGTIARIVTRRVRPRVRTATAAAA